jgi:hypothetical protein
VLVVTDSNRKRGALRAIRDVEGATQRADEQALVKDEGDAQLELFPGEGSAAQTVVVSPGAKVSTTRYGNRITYWQEQRGSRAFDGDTSTSWQFGTHDTVEGERLRLDLSQPITTDHVNLVQRLSGDDGRYLTQVTLTFDGGQPVTVTLDPSSRSAAGQTVPFPRRTFSRMDVRVDDTNVGDDLTGPINNVASPRSACGRQNTTDVRSWRCAHADGPRPHRERGRSHPRVQMSRSRTIVVPPRTGHDGRVLRSFAVPGARAFRSGARCVAAWRPTTWWTASWGSPARRAG